MDQEIIDRQARISKEASKLLAQICELFRPDYGDVRGTINIESEDLQVTLSTEPIAVEEGENVQVYRNLVGRDLSVVSILEDTSKETIN